jgi:hypothetical protein
MGERMRATELKARVLPSLLAGTSRHPLGPHGAIPEAMWQEDGKPVLKILSLTGQALRFEKPSSPQQFSVEPEIRDDRRILPDRARRPLIRLLTGRRATEDVALAVAWAFDRLKLRPHPFDLPKLDDFVRAHAEYLGATAQYWATRQEDVVAPQPDYFGPEALDDTTWNSAPVGRRVRFIEERRRQDAGAARALLEATLPQKNADARVRLLMALQTELSSADQSFLEELQKDRAPRVRALAQRFLCRIPGATGEHPALRTCVERIRKSETGLLRKRMVLTLELPSTVKETTVRSWIRELFAEVAFDELGRSLGASELEIIEAGGKDQNLLLGLAIVATQDRRFDLLEKIVRSHFTDAWEQMSLSGPLDLADWPAEQRMQWAEILASPYGIRPPMLYAAWSWLHKALKAPVPEGLMEGVVRSDSWLSELQRGEKCGPEWMEILAACCPRPQRNRLRTQLAAVDSPLTVTALPLMDILDTMEKA